MTKQEQIEEMTKTLSEYEINELTVEKDLAEFLYNAGYKEEKEVAKEIFTKLLKMKNPQGIIYTFTKDFMQLAKEYGIELE